MRVREREEVAVEPARVNGAVGVPTAAMPKPLRVRQTRPALTALGIVLIIGLGVLGGEAYHTAGAKTPVVVVVKPVAKGHVVTSDDLSTVDVAGGVVAIAGDHLNSVLGETATVDLLPDTLLQRSMVTSGPVMAAGTAQVGVQVTGGQIPADGLNAGDTVEVLGLPVKGSGTDTGAPAAAALLVANATVFSTRPDPSSAAGTLVTLTVPASTAAAIAAASGNGLVALVKVAS